MSNIIRTYHQKLAETKVIGTKKIEIKKPVTFFADSELDPKEQKQLLLNEIEKLQDQHMQLLQQIEKEQEKAQAQIKSWWEEKQTEANVEAERLATIATEQGFQEGYQQGIINAEAEYQQQRQEMMECIETAYEEKARIIQKAEPFLLSLSVKIAEKIIKEELKQHGEQLINMVRQALKNVEEYDDVIVQVSPEDYSTILPFIEELQSYIGADAELKVVPLPNFSKGGCMIHTKSGSYDVTISSQLQEIKQQLLTYSQEKTNDES